MLLVAVRSVLDPLQIILLLVIYPRSGINYYPRVLKRNNYCKIFEISSLLLILCCYTTPVNYRYITSYILLVVYPSTQGKEGEKHRTTPLPKKTRVVMLSRFSCSSTAVFRRPWCRSWWCRPKSTKPRVVVLGTGWGGNAFARKLDKAKFDVQVVSPSNHFLFTPFLPQTAVGTFEFRVVQEVRAVTAQ